MGVALLYTRLGRLPWIVAMNLRVLKHTHNIMQNVKVMEDHIVTQVCCMVIQVSCD